MSVKIFPASRLLEKVWPCSRVSKVSAGKLRWQGTILQGKQRLVVSLPKSWPMAKALACTASQECTPAGRDLERSCATCLSAGRHLSSRCDAPAECMRKGIGFS